MPNSARHSTQVVLSIGDVVLFRAFDGELVAGDVWSNFEAEGLLAAFVQPWRFVSKAHGAIIWEVVSDDDLAVVFSEDIVDHTV